MSGANLVLKSHFDDLNLAEASLISCLTRLKKGETKWEHDFVIAGRPMRVECLGNSYGFPHGPDNDMMLLLTNLYLEHGQPRDNAVQSTAYALLKMLGRSDSAQNYRILHDSLTRLSGTLYKISGWLDQPGGAARRVTFRFLERVEEIQGEAKSLNLKSFGAGTQLRITLDKEVAASLSSSRVRPFDLDFMLKLPGSQSRMLFRLLDTLWYSDPQAGVSGYLEFELIELGKLLRLINLRPDSIRRTILPIHDELIASEFLKGVEFVGRGAKQRVRYTLNPQRPDYPLTAAQLELVGRIKNLDVSDGQARDYVRKNTLVRIRERLAVAERIISSTQNFRKSKSAYAWDILQDDGSKYAAQSHQIKSDTVSSKILPARKLEENAEKAYEVERERTLTLSPAEQWGISRGPLRIMLEKPLGAKRWKQLEQACKTGVLSAASLLTDANKAMVDVTMQEFIQELSEQVSGIELDT